jgi:ABC-2 type transport system ATP-binding protein
VNAIPRVPPGDSAVLIDDLRVRFGDIQAVAGISFAVSPGEVFGLLGPNGAGKTTTIRVLTTLLPATSGRARVAGFDVRAEPLAVRASIGYIPQAISVDGALTARENLDFYARVTGVPRRARGQRIAQAIAAMDLESMLDRLARTLSGGMLRRLEIATALLNRPAVCSWTSPRSGSTRRRGDWYGSTSPRCARMPARRSFSRPTAWRRPNATASA